MPGSRVRVPPLLLSKARRPNGLRAFVLMLTRIEVPKEVPTPRGFSSSFAAIFSHVVPIGTHSRSARRIQRLFAANRSDRVTSLERTAAELLAFQDHFRVPALDAGVIGSEVKHRVWPAIPVDILDM